MTFKIANRLRNNHFSIYCIRYTAIKVPFLLSKTLDSFYRCARRRGIKMQALFIARNGA